MLHPFYHICIRLGEESYKIGINSIFIMFKKIKIKIIGFSIDNRNQHKHRNIHTVRLKMLERKQRDGRPAGSGWNLGKCEASIDAPARDEESLLCDE